MNLKHEMKIFQETARKVILTVFPRDKTANVFQALPGEDGEEIKLHT